MLNFKNSFIAGSFVGVPQEDGRVFLVSANTTDMGHCSGYVGYPKGHPFHGINPPDMPAGNFAGSASEVDALEPLGDLWLIGFEHLGASDYVPGLSKIRSEDAEKYDEHTFESTFKELEQFAAEFESAARLFFGENGKNAGK